MADRLFEIGDGFWTIKGSFKVAPLVDIGTHASLVRRADGSFVLLDAYTLTGDVERKVMELTDGGRAVSAIANLHPFHTVHVKRSAAQFPRAKLYGSSRHVQKAPGLTWEPERVDSPEFAALFAPDLEFTIPRGVDFICADEAKHFSSVLAFHPASRTLHVDDTLMWMSVPIVGGLVFHPTLKAVLEKRPGAAADFRAWAEELIARCGSVDHLCVAHGPKMVPLGRPIAPMVRKALGKVDRVLAAHEKRHG